MKITIELSDKAVAILQRHLNDWNELCETEKKLSPAVATRLINKMITISGKECNLFEDFS